MLLTIAIPLLLVSTSPPEPQPESQDLLPSKGCAVRPEMEFPLFFQIKKPRKDNFARLQKQLGKRDWSCVQRGGWAYADMSRKDAEEILGKHASFYCGPRMGNRIGANAFFATVEPANFVPKALRPWVRRIYFNDDPKFYATDDPKEIECAKLR